MTLPRLLKLKLQASLVSNSSLKVAVPCQTMPVVSPVAVTSCRISHFSLDVPAARSWSWQVTVVVSDTSMSSFVQSFGNVNDSVTWNLLDWFLVCAALFVADGIITANA